MRVGEPVVLRDGQLTTRAADLGSVPREGVGLPLAASFENALQARLWITEAEAASDVRRCVGLRGIVGWTAESEAKHLAPDR